MVRFINGRELLCIPQEFTVDNAYGGMEAQREQVNKLINLSSTSTSTDVHHLQVPLILAWALSVHKSQGQTLERVKVDLRSVFEKGQG